MPATFSIPTPPTPSTGSSSFLAPNFTVGPTGKDPTRAWITAVVDGVFAAANAFDQPWRWDEGANNYPLGSTAPTTFAVADAAGGATFPIGTVVFYYLVFAVSSLGKETAPQYTAGVIGVSHTMVATKDVTITWTDPGGEYDVARIYRRLAGTEDFKLVAQVTASTATYTDSSSDASLATATAYVLTYRATLPDIFLGMFTAGNRLIGFTGDDPTLHLAQQARADARFVADDFYLDFPVEPNDTFGAIRAGWTHNGLLYVFKEDANYQLEGDDPSNFVVTRMYSGRGCLSMRAMIEIDDGKLVVLDKLGLYGWIPGGEPVVLGAAANGNSKLAPIWKRMNLGAAQSFFVTHDPAESILYFHIALDYEPVPNYVAVYNYKKDTLVTDPCVWGNAGGLLPDGAGARHRVRVDDFGILWEDGIGNADGVYAGSLTATLTATPTAVSWPASAAAFDTTIASGCFGSLVERYDTNGNVVDQNRVAAITGTAITPLYYSTSAPSTGQTVAVGAIPAVAEGGRNAFGTDQMKHVDGVVLEHIVEASSAYTLNFMSGMDETALARPPNVQQIDLSANEGRTPVCVDDRGWKWRWQLSQRYAGQGFTVQAQSIHMTFPGTPR